MCNTFDNTNVLLRIKCMTTLKCMKICMAIPKCNRQASITLWYCRSVQMCMAIPNVYGITKCVRQYQSGVDTLVSILCVIGKCK